MAARILGVIAFVLVLLLGPASPRAEPAESACGQEPGNRFYWVERAFCDLDWHGPERARGLVIWNHGISGTSPSWRAPVAPVFRLAQARGWDVIALKRHHLAETMPGGPLQRTVERTLAEAAAQRKAGYRKVVLAGQSFGGYVTLEAIDSSPEVFGAVAFAPGVRSSAAEGRLDPSVTDRILARARVGRLAVVFPRDDSLFGNIARGERARPILARRDFPSLVIDETSDVRGHGGAMSGRFALQYGACLVEFLSATEISPGDWRCPPRADPWPVVRDLLIPPRGDPPIANASTLPDDVVALAGFRWALLGDALVLVAPVEPAGRTVRLLYRSTGFGGGVVDAAVAEGGLRATLPSRATLILVPGRDGRLVWRAADGSRTLEAPLTRAGDDP